MSMQQRQHTVFVPRTYRDKVLATRRQNLIAYWPMGEPAGTNAFDASGYGRNIALVGVDVGQPGIGDGGNAGFWDGANDRGDLSVMQPHLNPNEGTIALWARVASGAVWTDATLRYLIRFGGSEFILIRKSTSNNSVTFLRQANAVAKTINATVTTPDRSHVAITWSVASDGLRAYINGVQSGATETGNVAFAGALSIGNNALGSVASGSALNVWNGWMAHCAIWNTPLTSGEIAELAVNHG